METFTREQITQIINDCETASFSNPKHCSATATDETLERIKEHFKPPNNKKLKLGGLPVCLYNKLDQCPTPYLCESCDDKPPTVTTEAECTCSPNAKPHYCKEHGFVGGFPTATR